MTHLQTVVEPTIHPVSCFGFSDGSIDINVWGGTPPYELEWNNGATGSIVDNLTQGNYFLFLMDGNGCTDTATYIIPSPDSLALTAMSTPENGDDMDGTITVLVNGGTAPYSFYWEFNPLLIDSIATQLTEGDYAITVTDANECTANIVAVIESLSSTYKSSFAAPHFLVAPNPSSGLINIYIDMRQPRDFCIKVHNSLGQLIRKNEYTSKDTFKDNISFSLPTGFFTISLTENEVILAEKRIVVLK